MFAERKKERNFESQDGFRRGDEETSGPSRQEMLKVFLVFASRNEQRRQRHMLLSLEALLEGRLSARLWLKLWRQVSHEAAAAVFAASHVVAEPWLATRPLRVTTSCKNRSSFPNVTRRVFRTFGSESANPSGASSHHE